MSARFALVRVLLLITAAVLVYLTGSTGQVGASDCIPDGGIDDTLFRTDCCSGQAVPGSTWCEDPADWGTTWESCYQICAPVPDCDQYDFGSCDYSWDPFSRCCSAPPTPEGYFCPSSCG
jgi:hypothetical protein